MVMAFKYNIAFIKMYYLNKECEKYCINNNFP